ncbi:hypothetical protein Bca52824_096945 [Brassica carinata]|uniref:Protein kinase domain-containing protein n=1 Tax=Brassica carinata TaxID=52824 RepID=A0A8X7P016_BRACI|nr:hypothetical protein Bca52824_096945 [Brassica carinata]
MVWWRKKKQEVNERQRMFMKNGSLLLEELIAISDDAKPNPIKHFSADQILEATNNFSRSNLVRIDRFRHYKGMLNDRVVLIKKWAYVGSIFSEKIYRDLAVSSMVSGHKNFLKLLGCCLEFSYPVLVCEYAEVITRSLRGARCPIDPSLTWSMRIPCQIFLNENGTAKLGEFCNSVFIPEGETYVQDDVVEGTYGFLDPNYVSKGLVTEKTDVYSFGAFMFVLLTGRIPQPIFGTREDHLVEDPERLSRLVKDGRFDKVVDKNMLVVEGRDIEQERLQIKAFLELSLRCIGRQGDVPSMTDVAKELKRIERSKSVPCGSFVSHV